MKKKIIISSAVIVVVLALGAVGFYFHSLRPVSEESNNVQFVIKSGTSSRDILRDLEHAGMIRNANVAFIYTKLNRLTLKAGVYEINSSMSTRDILTQISTGQTNETKKITFIEGRRLNHFVKQISEEFPYTEEEIHALLSDKEYLEELIDKYEFLTDEILHKDIYYPLEGYLFPDTYEFRIDASIKTIIEKMLDNTERKLKPLMEDIEKGKHTVHEILTMAAIIELEGSKEEDRRNISSVIHRRVALNMSLGMDPTTHYAVRKEITEPLTRSDLNTKNPFNTRDVNLIGLPIGPIANPSLMSIKATMNPGVVDYLFFVSDKNKKLYFTRNATEHASKITELRQQGLWLE